MRSSLWLTLLLSCSSFAALGQVLDKGNAARQELRHLPILFEPQVDSGGRSESYVGRTESREVRLSGDGVTVAPLRTGDAPLVLRFDRSRKALPQGEALKASHTNYMIGSDPSRWRLGVPNYGKIRFPELYAGVDAVFYGNDHSLEHDFVLSPGADVHQIGLRVGGDARVAITGDGELEIRTGSDVLVLKRPVAYQQNAGERRPVAAEFDLRGNGRFGFRVGKYDHRRSLVIDPVLVFATYVSSVAGGSGYVGVDAAGDTYLAGSSGSTFPVSAGAYTSCTGCGSQTVVFVSKLSPDGTRLLWSTVLGGNSSAQPTGLSVDPQGDAVVSGMTSANNFPLLNSIPASAQGTGGAFVFSLKSDGTALNFSTTLPGASQALAVATDSQGNAFVTGTASSAFAVTSGALNKASSALPQPEFNVFLTKLSNTGGLLYSAILGTADLVGGGSGPIGPSGLAVDSAGNAYVAGRAGSLWQTTAGAYSTSFPGTTPDAQPFVAKVNPSGSNLFYSTYLDGAGSVAGIVLRGDGSVLVGGSSPGALVLSGGTYKRNNVNGGYLYQLDATGSALQFSTTFFDTSFVMRGLALGPDGSLWVGGSTQSASFPTVNPLQGTFTVAPGGNNAEPVLAQFDPTYKNLVFSTYLSGSAGAGYIQSVAVDGQGYAHVGGAVEYGLSTTPGVVVPSVPQPAPAYSGNTYPFVAVVNAALPGPALCTTPTNEVAFGSVAVNGFAEFPVKLSNCGSQPLTISGVTSGAAVFTVPAAENTCTQAVAAGQSCTLMVRYAPPVAQSDVSSLTIASNAGEATQSLRLSGNGVPAPFFTASPGSLTFSPQLIGTTSASQTITLTNTGSAAAKNFSAQLYQTGANFAQTSTCGTSLAAGASCTIGVTFNPQIAGAATATLNVVDTVDVPFFQANYQMSGTGTQTGFSVATGQSGSTAATVPAGQTASYALTFASVGGYAGTVTFACGALPQNATCMISPSSLPVSGSGSQSVTVSIGTQVTQTARSDYRRGGGELLAAFSLPLLLWRRRKLAIVFAMLLVTVTLFTGCGGSGASSGGGSPKIAAVAPGTYAIQVTATDGKNSQAQTLTLTVQ